MWSGDRIVSISLYNLNKKVFETLRQGVLMISFNIGNIEDTRLYNSDYICNQINILLNYVASLTFFENYYKIFSREDTKLKVSFRNNIYI